MTGLQVGGGKPDGGAAAHRPRSTITAAAAAALAAAGLGDLQPGLLDGFCHQGPGGHLGGRLRRKQLDGVRIHTRINCSTL
jgi:hypothetical protein